MAHKAWTFTLEMYLYTVWYIFKDSWKMFISQFRKYKF